jgi:hypothetical protein
LLDVGRGMFNENIIFIMCTSWGIVENIFSSGFKQEMILSDEKKEK